jgi:flagellar hook-associated protein 1 FlgK
MSDLGLSIAGTGLAADMALIDTASNNLANASAAGYVAEKVNLSPLSTAGNYGVGQGVVIGSVTRLTDAVLGAANVAAQGASSAATQFSTIMSSVEAIFPEPSNNGIATQLTNLWSSMSTLASNPNQVGAAQTVVGAAQTLASSLSGSYSQLSQLSSSLQSQIGTGSGDGGLLNQVNRLLSQVASLNAGIEAGPAGGQNANALSDQSTADVNQLASLIGVNAITATNGTTSLSIYGVQLVSGTVAQQLSVSGSAATTNLSITTASGVVVKAGGQIGASLSAVNSTVPDYLAQLNSVADSLASSVNARQSSGLDSKGDPGSNVPGPGTGTVLPDLFVNAGSSSSYTASSAGFSGAATIAVSPTLLTSPTMIATASAPSASNSNVVGQPTLDGSNAQAMAALASSTTGADSLYSTLIGGLGTQASGATAGATMASAQATTASNNLSAVSGVNQNTQEMDIMSAQQAFQASAQVINAINQSFQSLLQVV